MDPNTQRGVAGYHNKAHQALAETLAEALANIFSGRQVMVQTIRTSDALLPSR
jgi:hypothetical protein